MRALRNIPCSAASTLSTPKSIDHLSNIYHLWERFLYFFNYFENRKNLFFFSPICFLFNYIFNHKIFATFTKESSRRGDSCLCECPPPFFLQSIAVEPVSRIIHSCLPRIAYTSLVTDANLSNSPGQVFTEGGEEQRFEDVKSVHR